MGTVGDVMDLAIAAACLAVWTAALLYIDHQHYRDGDYHDDRDWHDWWLWGHRRR